MKTRSTTPSSSTLPSGFALIVALALMGFIMLLLLSLSGLVRIEVSSTQATVTGAQARQNAILGLQVGLGHLQRALGPDQRVSARADILGPEEAQPLWTGVWQDPTPDNPRDEPQLREWLVSGNQLDDNIYTPTEGAGNDSVELVGQGSAANADTVRAPLVTFSDEEGAYAYWIGDEGVKANIVSLAQDYETLVEDHDPATTAIPLRYGIEAMSELGTYAPLPGSYASVFNTSQLTLLQDGNGDNAFTETSVKDRFADLTTYSRGLLTDTKRGGLKWDLSTLLELSQTDFANDFVSRMPGERMLERYLPDHGPRWDILRSFTQSVQATTNAGIAPFPIVDDESLAVGPLIAKFQCFVYITLIEESSTTAPSTGDTTDITYRPRIYYVPKIVLWNPYDVPLQAPSKGYQVRWRQTNADELRFQYAAGYFDGTWKTFLTDKGNALGDFPPLLKEGSFYEYLYFNIPAVTIPAGEAMVFTLAAHQSLGSTGFSYLGNTGFDLALGNDNYGLYHDAEDTFAVSAPDDLPSSVQIDLGRLSNNSKPVGSIVALTPYHSSRYYHLINTASFGNFMDTTKPPIQEGESTDPYEPSVFTPIIDSGSATDLTATLTPLGLDASLIAPEFKRDSLSSDRENARALTAYNLRAVRVGKLYFSNLYGNGDWGNSGEARTYDAYALMQYDPGNVDIQPMATLDTIDAAGTRAYIGLSDSPVTRTGSANTVERFAPFHLPRGEHPYWSVGDLMHVDIAGADSTVNPSKNDETDIYGPSYVVGNSRAPIMLQFDDISVEADNNEVIPDYSWIINDELWDRFYVSTLPATGAITLPLDNPRYRPIDPTQTTFTQSETEDLQTFDLSARTLMVDGSFNINSTSVEAWKALLSSFRDQTVVKTDGTQATSGDASPMLPAPFASGSAYADDASLDSGLYYGYRQLTPDEIDDLAEAIVEQVRLRGPFTSLADFVNRSVNPADAVLNENGSDFGENDKTGVLAQLASDPRMMGALQAAIDTAGLNDAFEDDWFFTKAMTSAIEAERPSRPPNIPAAMGATMENAPGYLSQQALLARLGPVLSPRSDTFVIRAYGETRDPLSGSVTARAWCEAVVQRYPEYVNDTADAPEASPATDLTNQEIGRRFRIIGFRWLNQDDV
ncbi:MAG: hypothetical protein Q7Q73_03960 [Verrucomicrobiota bacterium JB024]|nr:hypothetical protein [Verrucomicrobiota bacterium JB024]